MTDDDRERWNQRWNDAAAIDGPAQPPSSFAAHLDAFPAHGKALDIACGRGEASVWLAQRGLTVRGVDASDAAIAMAERLAEAHQVSATCQFAEWDLDLGLPPGEPVDLVLCHMFRDARLYDSMVERLLPQGLLAIAVRSEVGAQPGQFSAAPNELSEAFAGLDQIASHEGDGVAWLLARKAI